MADLAKVSVIVPLYNYGHYLEKCLDSIAAQTYDDFEILIIDDRSTDDSVETALKLMRSKFANLQIFIYRNERNFGLTKTRHNGILQADGEYFVFLDPDDTIDPTYLEKLVPVLDENPNIGFVYPDTEYFGAASHRFYQPEYNFFKLVQENFISYCALIRRDAYFDWGGFNLENHSYFEDWENWIRAGRKGWYGKHYPEKLFNYYVHEDSAIHTGFTAEAQLLFRAYFIKKYPELYHPDFQPQADQILKGVPENFMSMTKKENQVWWDNRKSQSS